MGSLFHIQFEDVIQMEEFDISLKLFHVVRFYLRDLPSLLQNTCPNLKCALDPEKHYKHTKKRKPKNKESQKLKKIIIINIFKVKIYLI
jgi:hypothetical protein